MELVQTLVPIFFFFLAHFLDLAHTSLQEASELLIGFCSKDCAKRKNLWTTVFAPMALVQTLVVCLYSAAIEVL